MPDFNYFKKLITDRLVELDVRIHDVDHQLSEPKSPELNEQAIDIEDDEVLEGLGAAAQKEISLLKLALKRIKDGTYGVCATCGQDISEERLDVVPFTPFCRSCAP